MKMRNIGLVLSVIGVAIISIPTAKILAQNTETNQIQIETESITPTVATTKKFTLENNDIYNQMFKMNSENIKSIKTNGSHYGSQRIENAIDGNTKTYWETNKSNNTSETSLFNNEVEVSFNESIILEKIVYGARPSDSKGFAEEFEVYASNTSQGDNYQLVATGSHSKVSGLVEAKFEPTTFKRLKFKFKKSNQNWATLNELWFYEEDVVANKVKSLFTDSTYSTVSDEFNTLDKITELENGVKSHPLYEEFKEDIENAKAIISRNLAEPTKALVTTFSLQNNLEYNELFKMDFANIKSIKNNGGHYAAQNIEKAIDDDLNTYWETNTTNTSNFKNEVEIQFNETVVLDRIVYGARASDNKGFAKSFEIYASPTTKGETYELVATGSSYETKALIEAKFEPTEFRRVKFIFKDSNQNWATAREFIFYQEDKLTNEIKNIFTDGTQSKLKPAYDEGKITELENEAKNHPLKDELLEVVAHAKKVLNNSDMYEANIMQLERRGNSIQESQKRKIWNFQDFIPTGYRVKSGDVINVFVDVEKGDPTPNIVFKQMESAHNGTTTIRLEPGKNTITIPEVEVDVIPQGVAKAGVLYVVNPYTEKEQTREPKIRFENLEEYPHYIKGIDNDEDVMKELAAYVALLNTDKTLPNVFEVFGDKTHMNVRATDALKWYTDNNSVPSFTANRQDEIINQALAFYGFDNSSEINSDFNFRYVGMIKNLSGGVFMNAANGITGVHLGDAKYLLGGDTGWGTMHELGHNLDVRNRLIVEVTNNILPLQFGRLTGQKTKLYSQYESRIFNKVIREDYSENEVFPAGDVQNISHIAMMWQLALYDEDFYPKLEQAFRESNKTYSGVDTIHNAWATKSSDILKMDMTEHFERHGANLTEETKQYNSQYPALDKKTWYLNDNKHLNDATVFTDNLNYEIASIKNVSNGKKLEFVINEEDKKNLMGYEIYRDDKLIGFTFNSNFIDTMAQVDKGYVYKIIAFDGELNEKGSHTLNSLAPVLKVQQEKVTIGLRDEFNPNAYIKAISHDGEDISDRIEVNHQVDSNVKGIYNVLYSISDENITTKQEITVEVVSATDYLSDLPWQSAVSQWGTPRRNTNIKGRIHGDIKTFDKGIGIHANGEIVFNLENEMYDKFEAFLGVDVGLAAQTKSSVSFKIIGDGEVLATTELLKHADDMVYVNVSIEGVKTLTIEVLDGGNGNESDHAIIVNPMFITNNKQPRLEIGEDELFVKLNSDFTLLDGVTVTDAEDGDITANVTIKDDGFNIKKSGAYQVTYSITDGDGNTVSKTKKIVVYSDNEYASDVKWESATTGWKTVNKDKAVGSENKIKLKINGTIKEFDKGIGVSTNSVIVYNLEGKEYKYFTTYLGTDKNYSDSRTTIDFTIEADGVEVYKSDTIREHSDAEFVSLDISGVKELKLIADKHDGNGVGDFTSYGDTQFYIENSSPTLEIEKSVSTKFLEPIEDIIGHIEASDREDGDLTTSVVVSGHETIDFNKVGEYTLTYTVTDHDNNTTTKERNIAVVDMRDAKFLTEYDWKSAIQSHSTPKKNTNLDGGEIKLTNESGEEVLYEKGIGVHANSTIIYDLSDKNYKYFTAFVGVDRRMYGTVGSVSFEVHVDNEIKFDSGLMTSTQPQKFVEVDINGAKELKLIVKDGGNGIGSDHASWGDTKLHFVNTQRVDLTSLQDVIQKAEAMDVTDYTEESVNHLHAMIQDAKELLNLDFVSQDQRDDAIKNIEDAIVGLEIFDQVITIEDSNLELEIKRTLGINDRDITLKDMRNLLSLTCESGYVKSLKGLEHAINLETLNIDYNEVSDLSPIKDLNKLTNFSGLENFIMNSDIQVIIEDEKFVIEEVVIDSDGEILLPKEIILSPNNNPIKLDLNEVLIGNRVVIDSTLIGDAKSVEIAYESKYHNYQLYTFSFLLK